MKGKIGTGKRVKQVLDWNLFYFVFQYFVYLLFSDPSFTKATATTRTQCYNWLCCPNC